MNIGKVPRVSADERRVCTILLCLFGSPILYPSISFELGETGGTRETNVDLTHVFAAPPVLRGWDQMRHMQRQRAHVGCAGSLLNAKPSIQLLLPVAALGHVVPP